VDEKAEGLNAQLASPNSGLEPYEKIMIKNS